VAVSLQIARTVVGSERRDEEESAGRVVVWGGAIFYSWEQRR
jgi:hypothetical protein